MATPVVMVPYDFEQLVMHRNDGTLHNVKLVECWDPSNFGSLDGFKKQLAGFLVNLSWHRDDPVISVSKKLENRAEAAQACVDHVKTILEVADPNLISLRCLNDELTDLCKFYTEHSSFVKWCLPNFVISAAEIATLRELLLTKIYVSQSCSSPFNRCGCSFISSNILAGCISSRFSMAIRNHLVFLIT